MQIFGFLSLFSIILFSAHYVVYASVISFFSVTNYWHKNILLAFTIFLPLSFFIASLLTRRWENFFTRALYFISGEWLGLLVSLLIAVAAVWLVILIAKLTSLNINTAIVAAIFFILAAIYSAYGIWNAYHFQVKNISVTIPNLPAQWKGKKIVQLSDAHLGLIYGESFIKNIVAKINSVSPDAVMITGDLFDGMDGNLEALSKPLNDLRADKGVFFVTGNHETYLGVDIAFDALQKDKVKILRDEVVDVDGLKIIGVNYPPQGESGRVISVLQKLKKDFAGQPNILLYHSPTNIEEIKNSGVNLQLSGHTHKGQLFPFSFITNLVYKGYDYGLYNIGGYTLYVTDGVGTWGPTMRTGNTPEIMVVTLN